MLRSALLLALMLALAGAGLLARADEAVRVDEVRFERSIDDEAWLLWAYFDLPLGTRAEQALHDGVTLYYVVEFDLTRPRWWWWDEATITARQTRVLSWHLLTRQYRVEIGGKAQFYASFERAASAVARVSGWNVAPVDTLVANTRYEARLRLRLDRERLPRAYQLGTLADNEWNRGGEWIRFTLTTALSADAP